MTKAADHPKVFISYAHESKEHDDRVLALANRLRKDGIDCRIDQYYPSPAEGWPLWMLRQIDWAKFVLIVFTATYHRRAIGEEEPSKGTGVSFESMVILNRLINDPLHNEKFVPVLFDQNDQRFVTAALQGVTRYLVTSPAGYWELYGRITNQPSVKIPRLGKRKRLLPKVRKTDFWEVEFNSAPNFNQDFNSVVALAKAQSRKRK